VSKQKHGRPQSPPFTMPGIPSAKPILRMVDAPPSITVHLPSKDSDERGSICADIRTKRGVWDNISPGKLIAASEYKGRDKRVSKGDRTAGS
jgi:hypothetical protein